VRNKIHDRSNFSIIELNIISEKSLERRHCLSKQSTLQKPQQKMENARDISIDVKFVKTLYLSVSTLGVKRVSWDERWPRNSKLILDIG